MNILNSDIDCKEKYQLLKQEIEMRLNVLSKFNSYTSDELDKLRKRYCYLSKKDLKKLTK